MRVFGSLLVMVLASCAPMPSTAFAADEGVSCAFFSAYGRVIEVTCKPTDRGNPPECTEPTAQQTLVLPSGWKVVGSAGPLTVLACK
jgi:hypothetical protein